MRTAEFAEKKLWETIGTVVKDVKDALYHELGGEYDDRMIEESMRECIANKLEMLTAGMLEMFTSPSRNEFHELAGILERRVGEEKAESIEQTVWLAAEYDDESIFNGNRPFSQPKMAAMIEYLAGKGHYLYKTSLNKLLFYSDLTNFYLTGHGMSGAAYHNRPFGPVADPAEPILSSLINAEKVRVVPRIQTLEAVVQSDATILTADECKVLDWVADSYGAMRASEISEYSHNEMAYKNTQPNEAIAYAYAQFLKRLPPRNLLGN